MDSSLEDHGVRTLTHSKSGSLCQVSDFGATVLCFHPSPAKHSEVLFVSRDAILNGSKAVRGGIPLCFPIFGPPSHTTSSDMPQHGFARTNWWKYQKHSYTDQDEHASMSFKLVVEPTDGKEGRGTKGLWAPAPEAPACELIYTLTLTDSTLTCHLSIQNTSTSVPFPVQALFHTYYEVHGKAALDTTKCYVKGLHGYALTDKVDSSNDQEQCTDETVVINGETDRVYTPPDGQPQVDVTIALNRPSQTFVQCTAKGTVDGTVVPVSCVVWNPHEVKAQKMSDFGDDQYHEMICVEPGILGKPILQPGKNAVLEMTIQVNEEE